MRKIVLLCVMSLVLVVVMGAYLETARSTSGSVRSAASSTDDALADLTWDALPSDRYKASRKQNTLVFHFTGSAGGVTCSDTEIWGYARGKTAQLQWIGLTTCGTLVTDDSTFLADTITTTTDETAQGITIRDGGANNRHATLRFDAAELEFWVVRFPSLASGTMNCYVTSY
ncbi:hypothetical protein LCGC14_1248610 [marine sediment metagenome]|uniref:Uncharacterized protein n=1 Tax=marine sediment metagenome TaxID=412755 RepID=A0A0F9P7P8_9ZZZZ